MKIFVHLLILLFLAQSVCLASSAVRVFKRTSDGEVRVARLGGPGVWPRTEDEDFTLLYGTLESYEVDTLLGDLPENTNTIDIVGGVAQFTPYTQEEIDNFPRNVRAAAVAQANADINAAVSVPQLKAALQVLFETE